MAESSHHSAAVAGSEQTNFSVTGLLLLVLAVMILIFLADRFLAQLEQRELRQAAKREYDAGEALRKEGKPAEAISHFLQAHTLVRGDKDYALAVADAEIASRHGEAARRIVEELLTAEPNDARANLRMARLLVTEGQFVSADAYYHRAIYGTWPPGSSNERMLDARLELAKMLAQHGSQQELLSETLALLDSAPESAETMRQVAPLLLRAGSGNRAAAAYRFLVRADRNDAEAWEGLGRADLEIGDYRAAESAFSSALDAKPDDTAIRRQVQLAAGLADMDPTPRRLATREKLRRSEDVLAMAINDAKVCLAGKPAPAAVKAKLDEADQLQAEQIKGTFTNEEAEARLDAAESIWAMRSSICSHQAAEDDPLPIIMSKLAAR